MKKSEILSAIDAIKSSLDSEMAHRKEDDLLYEFVSYVATRKDSLGEKARLILSVPEFEHWYA